MEVQRVRKNVKGTNETAKGLSMEKRGHYNRNEIEQTRIQVSERDHDLFWWSLERFRLHRFNHRVDLY